MARDREKMKQELLKRTSDDYNRQSGGTRHLRSDVDFPLWRPGVTKGDPHIIDIIPYVVGDKQPPLAMDGKVKAGNEAYVLEVEVHQNIGPAKQYILCPAKNYGLACPICEHVEQMIRDGAEWEDYSDIATKRRCLYNVLVVTDEKSRSKGVQVWDVASRYSQDKIKLLAKNPRTGGYVIFQHPDADTGKSISFEISNDKFKTQQGHKFLDRNYDIPDEVLDQAFALDELLDLKSYDYIKNAFYGSSDVQESKSPEAGSRLSKNEPAADNEPTLSGRRSLRRPAQEASSNPCPFGHNFGHDVEKHKDCESCEETTFQKCCEKADMIQIEEEERKKKEQEAAAASNPGATPGRRLLRRG